MTPKHPIPIRTTFRNCFVVNFTMAPVTLAQILPPPLTPELFKGRAFLSVVIVDMERMRPGFLPASVGVSYQQVLYRAIVRCGDVHGVHFLRSDADSRVMVMLGNLFSFFHFHHARIVRTVGAGLQHFDLIAEPGERADIHATFDVARASRQVPSSSVFSSLDEVQRFLIERYSAFSPATDGRSVSSVDIKRGSWNVRLVDAPRARFDLVTESGLFPAGSTTLDSVLYVEDIEYLWHTVKRHAVSPDGAPVSP